MMKRRRGPYKKYRTDSQCPVPRQTRHNWRKHSARAETTAHEEVCNVDVQQDIDELASRDGAEILSSDNDSPFEDSDTDLDEDLPPATENYECHSSPSLFEGAQITLNTGIMLITSLISRHKLTYQAVSDVLRILCLHLPRD